MVSQELTLLTRTRRRTPGCDRSTSTSIVSTARVVPTLSAPGRVGCRRTGRLRIAQSDEGYGARNVREEERIKSAT